MSDEWRHITATWDANSNEAKVLKNGQIESVSISGSFDTLGEKTPADKGIKKLEDNFEFSEFHDERVRKLFENDESLLDDLNHLVIAASLVLSDASQMTNGGLRAYEMGDKIIIEEQPGDEWKTVRTIGIQIAEILAHARAKSRVKEIEDRVSGIGSDSMEQIKKYDGFPTITPDGHGHNPDYEHVGHRPTWQGPYDTRTGHYGDSYRSLLETNSLVQELLQADSVSDTTTDMPSLFR